MTPAEIECPGDLKAIAKDAGEKVERLISWRLVLLFSIQ
jgi:hypothetical protein